MERITRKKGLPLMPCVDEGREIKMFKSVEIGGTHINRPVGTYTFSDFIEYIKENFDTWQTSPVIWDLTPSLLSEKSEPHDMIRGLLNGIKPLADRRAGARTAFVVVREYEYGMFRMLCALTECVGFPFELRVFKNLTDAQAWVEAGK